MIGIAGFDYDFHSLSRANNELADAYSAMFTAGQSGRLMGVIQALVPGARFIPTERQRVTKKARDTTMRIGRVRIHLTCSGGPGHSQQELVEEKKRMVAASYADGFEKRSDIGKDLLSILIKANMASDLPADQKLTDDEVIAQITTFVGIIVPQQCMC